LGYLGGEMIVTDMAIQDKVAQLIPLSTLDLPTLDVNLSPFGIIGALIVVAGGWWISQKRTTNETDSVLHETEMK
jgi:hypothetical protein